MCHADITKQLLDSKAEKTRNIIDSRDSFIFALGQKEDYQHHNIFPNITEQKLIKELGVPTQKEDNRR